jgi:glyoxylase I family protein
LQAALSSAQDEGMSFPQFVDHIVFRVSALDRAESFYSALLGVPGYRTEDSLMYMVGETRLFLTLSSEADGGRAEKERAGMNHIAFGVNSLKELEAVQLRLDAARIAHSGAKLEPHGRREFLWLDDPDGIRIEFYVRPPGE